MLPADKFGPTRIWGYNGQFPGPMFLARRGRPAVVRQTNLLHLEERQASKLEFATHLHGGNVDGYGDGHPLDVMKPGASKLYTYYNDQPAVTMWYHDHGMHHTARNVYMGLAGLYLVGDYHEDSLELPRNDPSREELFDIPLVIQDKLFTQDGSEFIFPPGDHPETAPNDGILGDTMLVNGAAWPVLEVQRRKYRFRILNASNAREYRLTLSSGQPFIQIGTEGGVLPRPLPQKTIHITPAERYEVVVDFSVYPGGTEVALQNLLEKDKMRKIMLFKVKSGDVEDSSRVPDRLMAPDLLEKFKALRELGVKLREAERRRAGRPSEITKYRTFRLERSGPSLTINGKTMGGFFTINGKIYEQNRDDADPKVGAFEVWTLKNSSGGWFHPLHLHLLHVGYGFVLLDRNGRAITDADQEWGWKETANVGRNQTVRVLMHWPEVPVNPDNRSQATSSAGQPPVEFYERRYVFHCHNIDHEDHDMMGQMRVDPPASSTLQPRGRPRSS
jgi:spore coat protein A